MSQHFTSASGDQPQRRIPLEATSCTGADSDAAHRNAIVFPAGDLDDMIFHEASGFLHSER